MLVRCFGIILFVFLAITSQAQSSLSALLGSGGHHTKATLVLSAETVKPGDTFWAGIDMKMEPGWHTYWKNPGDAGMSTKIQWQLPAGITAGEIQWPLPEKLPPAEVTTYGYDNEVMLLVPLTVSSNVPMGQVDLKAKVSWLECKEVCIPADQEVEGRVGLGAEAKESADKAKIEEWEKKMPVSNTDNQHWILASASWENASTNDIRPVVVEIHPTKEMLSYLKTDFFPDANDAYEVQAATKELRPFWLEKMVKKYSGDWPREISGVIVMEQQGNRMGFQVSLPVADSIPADARVDIFPGSSKSNAGEPPALLWMLLYAFIGGLILNIMPCVLPVIALKILGFVSEARSEPRRVRNLGLIYAVGVLMSFLVFAGLAIGLKLAWGAQFGNPIFVVCLTVLVLLVALNLFGVFEVTPGGRIMNAAGKLSSKHGATGAFFNGILAVILATPCTAPFLSSALGFTLAQNAGVTVLVFLFVGIGLAAPYVLLSFNPKLLKYLPKPGAWMEKFKIAMGFPMLATVVWLFNIASSHYGKNVLWLGIFLVGIALVAWVFGEFVQRHRKKAGLTFVVVLLMADYTVVLEKELNWRHPVPAALSGTINEAGIEWRPWSPDAVAKARAEGHPVLVDFTADWCLTCQVNKKLAIEVPSVRAKLKEIDAVTFIADYTRTPTNILSELTRYGRPSVPLVLVYPKDLNAEPMVLPEVLTPGIVLGALEKAGSGSTRSVSAPIN
ncbi:MAG TPA: protein-disulfide reductase DsbD domain-containing protein [Desulfuromonadaceae bacterium]|nr:protein-disulfide reductase DsbD domain-containing protein [Desulfuromonadaceae bacterium]